MDAKQFYAMQYQAFLEAVDYTKKQIWQMANYGLLLQAAIFGFSSVAKLKEIPIQWQGLSAKINLCYISKAAFILALFFIVYYSYKLEEYRKYKKEYRKRLESEIEVNIIEKEVNEKCDISFETVLFAFVFIAINAVAMILVVSYAP